MEEKNSVFIAISLEGRIADKNGNIDWLHQIPNPENNDMGYSEFIKNIDALIMGRTTFETVCGFDIEWPYTKPVYVLTNTLREVPPKLKGKVFIIKGELTAVIKEINKLGHKRLYIDGGKTIQSFLKEDLIDEITLTTIPILLGGGPQLFDFLENNLSFNLVSTKTYLNQVVQSTYQRERK